MIENFQEKLEKGQIQLEFAESGNIAVIERRFNETNGVPEMKPTQECSSKQLDDLIADNEVQIAPFLQKRQDLADLKTAVLSKEEERQKLIEKKSK